MTDNSPLRLVIDRGDRSVPALADVPPPDGSVMHLHIHVSGDGARETPEARNAEPLPPRKSDAGRGRPLLLACVALLIAAAAFDAGVRSGRGASQAALPASVSGVAASGQDRAEPVAPPAAQDPLPAIRQQLAQPPTIVSPNMAGSTPGAGSNDPFGLQR